MGQLNDARRVAQRYLMLSVASRQPSPNDYLDGLKVQKQRAVFETLLRQYLEQLRATVDQAERDRPDTRSQRSGNDTTTFRPGRSSAEQLQISQAFSQPSSLGSTQGTGAHDRHNRQPSRPSQPPRTQSSTSGLPAAHQDRRYRSGSDVSDLDTTAGGPSLIGMGRGLGLGLPTLAEDDIERLEKGFKVHTGAKLKTVFQRGSLVVVFWHENYGSSLPPKKLETLRPPPKDGKLGPGWVSRVEGEVVYSHKRRFIIVNERSGFSVGIPITSYGGRGLTIKNMSREEQRAHAIVYTLDSEPRPLPGEPPFTKDPICIDTSISGETLSSSSRLYYAKPQSIDHNIKIKHLGKVIDSDVRTLLLNYRAENLPQVQ
ncbi:hypothetical protein OHC33_010575 [Knufia fluminis]|uniref:DUF6590 domain-containing protein n=1 Tax=Knufia fluminis TaxID=191047 RepID=A0AAN8EYJ9_9EURO|nr:hypothetical protein OHC33_010575 [Knufia fluminis]